MGPAASAIHDAWARSAVPELTGLPDGPALRPPGTAAVVCDRLARRIEQSARRAGIALDVDGAALLGQRAALRPLSRAGRTSPGGSCRLLPTRDGWVAISAARPDDPALLGAAMGVRLPDDADPPWGELMAWVRSRTGEEIAGRLELLGIAGAPVRRFDLAAAAAVSDGLPGLPSTALARGVRAVAGRTVVDFSAMWAGPLAAHLLALAGASVTTIESRTRPDGARRGDPHLHRLLHEGHAHRRIDPRDRGDLERLRELVFHADIVIEASRPRALRAWGIDAAEFVRRGGTWISLTAGGRRSDRVGFGDDIAASAGMLAVDDRGLPVFVGDAIADPLAGITAAALAVSEADDGGVLWDCAMAGIAAECVGDEGYFGDPQQDVRPSPHWHPTIETP